MGGFGGGGGGGGSKVGGGGGGAKGGPLGVVADVASLGTNIIGATSEPDVPSAPVPSFEAPPEPAKAEDAAIQKESKDEKRRRAKASGLSQTILTSGQGLTDEATTQKPTLLGS